MTDPVWRCYVGHRIEPSARLPRVPSEPLLLWPCGCPVRAGETVPPRRGERP